jgi:hypothetical protein
VAKIIAGSIAAVTNPIVIHSTVLPPFSAKEKKRVRCFSKNWQKISDGDLQNLSEKTHNEQSAGMTHFDEFRMASINLSMR